MTADVPLDRPVDRRFLMRGGAVLAGAAGATVLGAALSPTKANAADGNPLIIGDPNTSSSTTSLTINGTTGSEEPTLTLVNANGPSLALPSADVDFDTTTLGVGEIANTDEGPWIGVDYGGGATATYLATATDLDSLPVSFPFGPERMLDTRTAAGRESIVGQSGPLDPSGRLQGGNWIDVALLPDDDPAFVLFGAFFNLTVAVPATSGFLTAYPPEEDRPLASTLNFIANVSLSNFAYVAPAPVAGAWAIRIYASRTTHVVVDLTGLTSGFTGGGVTAAEKSVRVARRQARQDKLRDRLAKSVGQRASR